MMFLDRFRRISKRAVKALGRSSSREMGKNPLGQTTMKADVDVERAVFDELRKLDCIVASEEAGLKKFSRTPRNVFVVDPLDASENYARGIPNYVMGIARAPVGGRLKDVEEAYVYDLVTKEEFYSVKGKCAWRNGKRMRPSGISDISDAIIAIDFYNTNARTISDSTRAKALGYPKDMRRFGPALLEMAYVAAGSLEGYFNVNDTLSTVHACGPALMKHAGCVVTDHNGEELDFGLEKVDKYFTIISAGNEMIHRKLMEIARG